MVNDIPWSLTLEVGGVRYGLSGGDFELFEADEYARIVRETVRKIRGHIESLPILVEE